MEDTILLSSLTVDHLLLDMVPTLKYDQYNQWDSIGEKQVFLLQVDVNWK